MKRMLLESADLFDLDDNRSNGRGRYNLPCPFYDAKQVNKQTLKIWMLYWIIREAKARR